MKPKARGYLHQLTFIISIVACTILIMHSRGSRAIAASVIYSLSLTGMYGISGLYHVPMWSRQKYLILRRIDHSTIYILIAGTATPICLLSLKPALGYQLLLIFWVGAIIGVLMSVVWTHGPKWVRSLLYVTLGWLGILYYPDIQSSLSISNLNLLIAGGVTYTLGAIIYAIKWPNPFPTVFGYHEVFHVLVIIASAFHFILNYSLVSL